MNRGPRKTMTILDRGDFRYILLIGFLGSILTLVSFGLGLRFENVYSARSMAFTTLTLVQPLILIDLWLSHRLIAGNLSLLTKPIFAVAFALPFLIQPFLLYQPLLQPIFKTAPLPPQYLILAFGLALFILLPIEIKKLQKSGPTSLSLPQSRREGQDA